MREILARNPRARLLDSSGRNAKGRHHARSVGTFDDNGRRCRRWQRRHLYVYHTNIGTDFGGFSRGTDSGDENALG